jgi:hypothetical protein
MPRLPHCGGAHSAEPSFLRSLVNINKFRFTYLFMFTRSLENKKRVGFVDYCEKEK